MTKFKRKLLIIDGNALIHRSFHALPPTLRTKDGTLVNAVYGFTSFLLKALSEFKPEFVILTLDKAGPTFRHEMYTPYKATRTKAADELYIQIPLVKEVANAFSIPIFEKSGFEADDLIGSLAKQARSDKDLETIIVTGDMDTIQLIDRQTKIYTMSRGLSESVLYDEEKVRERYQFSPEQIIDFKALAGDPSDNIPGAKGIGQKTATDLILNYKDIEGIYEAVDKEGSKIKERTLKLLKESRENVFLSKELATINCEAPIELSLNKSSFSFSNLDPILQIFQSLEFKSLLNKVKTLKETWGGGSKDPSKKYEDAEDKEENKENEKKKLLDTKKFNFLKTNQEISDFIKNLEQEKIIGFQVINKYKEDFLGQEILGFSFCFENDNSYFLPFQKSLIPKLKKILEDDKIKKIGHDIKPSFKALKEIDINLNGIYFDTLIAAYLLNPGQRNYQVENLAFTELEIDSSINNERKDGQKLNQLSLDLGDNLETISSEACKKIYLVCQLKPIFENKLKEDKLWEIFQDLEIPLISVLGIMENQGIKIKVKILNDLEKEVAKKIKTLEDKIYKEAGKEFNINSTKQLKELLFIDLEIPTKGIKKTKTGFSTAEDELNKLKDIHPIISLLQDYREFSKLQSTYLSALPKIINPKTGRIHTHYSQIVAATGRLSSHDPNLQNIPTKTKEGRRIREAFVAEEGFLLVGFDYSQIELRLAAHFSKDEKMLKAFRTKSDIHTETAAQIHGIKTDEVTKKMRQEAKAINFGILYGQGPHGLSQSASIPYGQAQEFIKKYFASYPKIKKMTDHFIKEAETKGYASTLLGRKRPLYDINSSMPMARKGAQRMAINTPIQGTAADMIKQAMIKIMAEINGKKDEIRLLLQVHDELIFEIQKDKIEEYSEKIIKIMESNANLNVPILVEKSSGHSWENLK